MRFSRFIALSVCLSLCMCLFGPDLPRTVRAESSQDIREEIDELEEEAASLSAQISQLEQKRDDHVTQMRQMAEQKNLIDQQISLYHALLLNLEEQILALRLQTVARQEEFDRAQADYNDLKARYLERIRVMEEQGSLSYWSVLFHANSFSDFLDRINMIEEIAIADRNRLQQLQESARQLEEARDALLAQQAQLQEKSGELEQARLALDQKRLEADAILQELAAQTEEYELLLAEAEEAEQQLLLEIAQKEAEFDRLAYEEWLASQPPATGGNTGGQPSTDAWLVPVPYYTLSSPFGMRMHPIYNEPRMHNGIDMACAQGTEIYASRGGQVTIAKYSDSAGNYVQINHGDGYRSVYMHMTHYVVKVGDYVAPGQVIGFVGNTGASKGAHLHFGISYNGQYIDPLPLIRP